MIVGDRGRKRLTDALLRSTDERSFARVLEGATVNFLRDVSRRTDLGRVVLRVTDILRTEDRFVEVPGYPPRWKLSAAPDDPSRVGPDELAHAARRETDVVVPAWTSEHREAPIADRATLVRILTRVLTAAGGSITTERVAAPALDAPAAEVARDSSAKALFSRLDDRERILLAGFHLSLSQAAEQLAVGRSQTSLLRQRLVERLRREFGSDLELDGSDGFEDAEIQVRVLRDLCVRWVEDRTPGGGATFTWSMEGGPR